MTYNPLDENGRCKTPLPATYIAPKTEPNQANFTEVPKRKQGAYISI